MKSKRELLRRTVANQARAAGEQAVDAGDDAPPVGRDSGSLAARAAALIAGQAEPPARKPKEPPQDDQADDDEEEAGDATTGDGDEDIEADEDEQAADDAPVKTIDDAAKQLGLSRKEFNELEVNVRGETMTIGDLKSRMHEVLTLDKARDELDDERGKWELERIASYRNLNAIVDALPRNAQTQGLLKQLEQQHESTRARELENLHFARPKWADTAYATAARQKITALAREYGFSVAEVNGLMDHRQVLLVQDYAELRDKVKASREAARKVHEPTGERPSGQGAAARGAAGHSANGSGRRIKESQSTLAARAGALLRRK